MKNFKVGDKIFYEGELVGVIISTHEPTNESDSSKPYARLDNGLLLEETGKEVGNPSGPKFTK
jgi:hypothetical protein